MAWWIPLLAMAAGTAVSAKANKDARKAAMNATMVGKQRQRDVNKDKQQIILGRALPQYDPATRNTVQDSVRSDTENRMTADLLDARETGPATMPEATGKISGDESTTTAKMMAGELARASNRASLMSRYRAPTDLRFEEGLNNAGYGSEVDVLSSRGQHYGQTDRYLTDVASIPDSGMLTLGSLLSAYGMAAGMGNIANLGSAGAGATAAVPQAANGLKGFAGMGTPSSPFYVTG
jgi:hypothetical protein